MAKLTIKEKKQLLKEHEGQVVFSYHAGPNDIINGKTMEDIEPSNIDRISKRKQAYLHSYAASHIKLWDETEGGK